MMEIEIRPTIAPDLPRLMGMDHSTMTDYVWQLEFRREGSQMQAVFREVRLPRPITVTYPHNPYALADEWTNKSLMLTALQGQNPVGYLCLLEHSRAALAWITDLVVWREARRQGVGSALITAAQAWASGRGDRRLMLEMQSKNVPAIRLAQKHGFEFCGYNDHYYLTQDVALFFAKNIK
jgi:ribosomal protein S18 acetylase RimI-like enzyme